MTDSHDKDNKYDKDNHEKSRLRSAFRDAALFGRVISAGLVVAGYAFAGI